VIFIVWYKKFRHRRHDNIMTLPGWTPLRAHIPFLVKYLYNGINEQVYELLKQSDFPPISSLNGFDRHGLLIMDPEILKFVWYTKFESFQKTNKVRDETEEMLGDGIFASDPPKWQFHRKIASRMFSMRTLKDYMFECTVKHTKHVIDTINSDEAFLQDINIYDMLARFTLDTFTAIAFGKSCESTAVYPQKHAFADSFDNLMTLYCMRHFVFPFIWKPIKWLPYSLTFGNEYLIKRESKVIHEFADQVLQSRGTTNITDEAGQKQRDIISLFKKYNKDLTKEQLKYIALNMIIAGRDTTRLLLSWFLYNMCLPENKEVKGKILGEIGEFITKHNTTEMSYDKVNDNLMYLESALLETLRLYPSVPFLIRFAMEDVELPTGQTIRKGDELYVITYAYGRNPKIYKDPLKFDPNRFYGKSEAPVNVYDVYRYPFFNTNPRLCLGRKLALMESKVFLFYFLQQFEFEMADPNQDIRPKTGIVLNMEEGLRLKLTRK
jgi:fatty acid omega-hydroxylase